MFRNKNRKEVRLLGVPGNLIKDLKSYREYVDEGVEIALKMSKLLPETIEKLKNDEIPEELKKLSVRTSELVLLIEFTEQYEQVMKKEPTK